MKKLSPEEKEKLQQKTREYHQDRMMRVAREADGRQAKKSKPLSPKVSILVVILSAGIAVGLLVFMWQFLMDTLASRSLWLLISLFVICLFLSFLAAIAFFLELGSGLNQLWRVILGFLSMSAVAVILTVCFLALVNYGHWIGAWEGRVVKKYTYKKYTYEDYADERTVYAVGLTTGHKEDLPYSDWNRVKVGDYIVKKSRSYTIEIRPKP